MNNLLYLLLQRMRLPLIVVILAYATSITGLVLIPGMDDQGNPWQMSIFHAFYFVSFMGSTIGFGEIPYPFTDPQRIWTTVAMYLTVISWLYAIGSLFAVLQDPAFKRVLAYATFTRSVRKIKESFYFKLKTKFFTDIRNGLPQTRRYFVTFNIRNVSIPKFLFNQWVESPSINLFGQRNLQLLVFFVSAFFNNYKLFIF